MAKESDLLLAKLTKMTKKRVFIENTCIETQTIFCQDGNIHIHPCPFEENKFIVANGDCASQKGRMITLNDGTSCFRAYAPTAAAATTRSSAPRTVW